MTSMRKSFQDNFMAKIRRNPSNIHKVMTVCQMALLGGGSIPSKETFVLAGPV